MKITVLGATGMVGSAVAEHFSEVYGYENVIRTSRSRITHADENRNARETWVQFTTVNCFLDKAIPHDTDYVFNCIGVIKPLVEKYGTHSTIEINSVFPHILEEYCENYGIKLIHLSSDCVFDGSCGDRLENDTPDASDLYGRTKALGEPITSAMTLRTSIIGREPYRIIGVSLVAWAQRMAGQDVNGYVNHFWNGMTSKTYAECCDTIIDAELFTPGMYHIFSPTPVSKCELVQLISNVFQLNLTVNPVVAPHPMNMTLCSDFDLCLDLDIPELVDQMKGL